jgi:hypothetical protein
MDKNTKSLVVGGAGAVIGYTAWEDSPMLGALLGGLAGWWLAGMLPSSSGPDLTTPRELTQAEAEAGGV